MALRKYIPAAETTVNMKSLSISTKGNEKDQFEDAERSYVGADVDIDIREVYFLIMHFLSAGPCHRTYGQLWNELLEHQLLPRRYHAWYSRSGLCSGDENDDGTSFPLSYNNLVERYSHIEKDHLVKLLKQLIMCTAVPSQGVGGNAFNAAAVPTLLGTRSFSLLTYDRSKTNNEVKSAPSYMRWPHMLADQVRGLSLREIGGGFSRHNRSPSIRAACYAIAKPSTMVQRMENIKRVRGHRNAVYCATFDRSGRFVVTGSDDRLVKIWSMETAYCLASCRGHEGDITDLAVSFNNTLVASASNDCIIRVWRLNDGLPISVLRGHTGAVTAIAFSPRPSSVYQLLSSSDDGSCRIWDARYSHLTPRMYIPKPPESVAVKNNGPSSSAGQQSHQIFCCAFNASGTVFVTGSSDTLARVWNAAKSHSPSDDSEHLSHEMDILAGHENDVNYVQFSGCAVPFRFSASDASKEDNIPKFKTTWFNHDNIVTCSRDGSAIIWIPKSRRSHGKAGRWTRAYHLKVPPPPMPPQPPRGGPRQRILPTPRGVNMIVWSLDNRFVLAAIMDCRICVWNAVDGSLVHSLTGHTESTYVLDVHPFNPRIAMSAGYDGKTIVWDIWEGVPIRTYEIGRFKLVDGKFSPDGTSIILSDDVGQLYILNTGQGESQKDAKYDQFFLGDYRPLIQDTHGNILDQETQLVPYRRNMQDLLCDSGMIPYTEPYQSVYQQHRLGALGIEWRPSSLRFAVGVDISLDQEYHMLPIADLETLIDPLPEFLDIMDWEPEIEVRSDDTDSEYHVTEEYSSGWEQGSLSSNSSGDPECSAEDSEVENAQKDIRRSKRKKQKAEVEIMTSSGRRVKRKNLNECTDGYLRNNHTRKSKNGRKVSKGKSSLSKSLRPQRAAARNALNLFSRITGTSPDVEDEEGSEGNSSESESTLQESNIGSEESDISLHKGQCERYKGKEVSLDEPDDRVKAHGYPQLNAGNRKKLVLKLPNRDANKSVLSVNATIKHDSQPDVAGPSTALINNEACNHHAPNLGYTRGNGNIDKECQTAKIEHHFDLLEGYKNGKIRWGGVKTRTRKRPRMGEFLPSGAYGGSSSCPPGDIEFENPLIGQLTSEKECISTSTTSESQGQESEMNEVVHLNEHNFDCDTHKDLDGARDDIEHSVINDHKDYGQPSSQYHKVVDDQAACPVQGSDETDNLLKSRETSLPVPTKLRIKSKVLSGDHESPMMVRDKSSAEDSRKGTCDMSFSNPSNFDLNFNSEPRNGTEKPSSDNGLNSSVCKVDAHFDASSRSLLPEFHNRMYSVVYRRSKLFRGRSDLERDSYRMEAGTSKRGHHTVEGTETNIEGGCRTRSKGLKSTSRESNIMSSNARLREVQDGSEDTSTSIERSSINRFDDLHCEEWRSSSRGAVGLRSTRIRRSNYYSRETSHDRRKSNQSIGSSWLMVSMPEDGCRYIPQMGDEVVYLRQGHQDYIDNGKSKEIAPWKTIKGNMRAVEFCRVADLEYSALSGSGESCCKMTLQFLDPNSSVAGKIFKLTLPEDTGFPDFIVERSRYDAAIQRNWSFRDKCQVWWKNEGEGGSWYEGRIVSVKAKTPEFPDSPWERYVVKYKSYAENQEHSPWELFDADTHWEDPHIDDGIRDKLLHAFTKLEQSGNTARDYYGVQKLRQASQRSNFVNRFPVPLSLELIRSRLQNNFYRSLLAMKHDVRVMLSNAESYFGRSAELSAKMRHLSDWFERTISSL